MRLHFAANIQTVSELCDKAAQGLFYKIQSHEHCLNFVLSEKINIPFKLGLRKQ